MKCDKNGKPIVRFQINPNASQDRTNLQRAKTPYNPDKVDPETGEHIDSHGHPVS